VVPLYKKKNLGGLEESMKRLILTATAILFSTLTLGAQTGTSVPATAAPTQAASTAAHPQRHRNKQHNHRHHPRRRTGINARR
jgi:hypothetical protein